MNAAVTAELHAQPRHPTPKFPRGFSPLLVTFPRGRSGRLWYSSSDSLPERIFSL